MGRTALRRLTGSVLGALLAAGCRMPPGQVTACRPTAAPRPVLLTAQAFEDTAVMAAAYPVRSGRVLLTEPVGYFRAGYAGLAEKRVCTKLLPPPEPIRCDRPTLDRDELEADARRISGVPRQCADI
ncbi:MAG TPA: hypothetical protein VGF55_08685, partial [Gemmataceae bacterium]